MYEIVDNLERNQRVLYRDGEVLAVVERDQCTPCVGIVRFLMNLGDFGDFRPGIRETA